MSKHLIDPALAAGLAAFPPFEEMSLATLSKMRAMIADIGRAQIAETPLAGVVFCEEHAPGLGGAPDVRVLTYRPDKKGALPAYLHIHGGGLVSGIPEMRHLGSVSNAQEYGCAVISVDYRVAPETKFPGAVEDCLAALRWIHANAKLLGVDPAHVVIGGESAGGGLAAALAILARDTGGLPVAFQMLTYPMLDDRTGLTHDHEHVGHFVWTRPNNHFGWQSYLGQEPGGPNVSPHAAPARCKDLRGLPPAFVGVGSLDLFVEEDIEYARRLIRAGVSTELHVYPGAYHAFDLVTDAEVTKAFRRDWRRAMISALARKAA